MYCRLTDVKLLPILGFHYGLPWGTPPLPFSGWLASQTLLCPAGFWKRYMGPWLNKLTWPPPFLVLETLLYSCLQSSVVKSLLPTSFSEIACLYHLFRVLSSLFSCMIWLAHLLGFFTGAPLPSFLSSVPNLSLVMVMMIVAILSIFLSAVSVSVASRTLSRSWSSHVYAVMSWCGHSTWLWFWMFGEKNKC